jgi:hypothetical protein
MSFLNEGTACQNFLIIFFPSLPNELFLKPPKLLIKHFTSLMNLIISYKSREQFFTEKVFNAINFFHPN